MASISIGNTLIVDDKIYAGGKINPQCYLGNTQFYPEEEFERWKITKITLNYSTANYNGLRANGSNYCRVTLTITKGKQKRNGEWRRTVLLNSDEFETSPDDVSCRYAVGSNYYDLVEWDNTDKVLRWNTEGQFRTNELSAGNYRIVCYYQNPKYNDGHQIVSTTDGIGDGVTEKTVYLEGNHLSTVFSIDEITFSGAGLYESNPIPASGKTDLIFNGYVYSQRIWTTGITEGEKIPSSSQLTISNPGRFIYQYVDNTWKYIESEDFRCYVWVDGGNEEIHCQIPSLKTTQMTAGYYEFTINISNPSGYADVVSNKIKIYQEANNIDSNKTVYNVTWKYRESSDGTLHSIPTTSTEPALQISNSTDKVYINASVLKSVVYTSGSPISDTPVSMDSLYVKLNDSTNYINRNVNNEWEILIGESGISDKYFGLSLYVMSVTGQVDPYSDTHITSHSFVQLSVSYKLSVNDITNMPASAATKRTTYTSTWNGSTADIEVVYKPSWVSNVEISTSNIDVTCNQNSGNERSDVIRVRQKNHQEVSTSFSIVQAASSRSFSVVGPTNELSWESGEFQVSVYSEFNEERVQPTYTTSGGLDLTLKIGPVEGDPESYEYIYIFGYSKNSGEERTGTITFNQAISGLETRSSSCTVTQSAAPQRSIVLLDTGRFAELDSTRASGTINANLSYVQWSDLRITNVNNVDWFTLNVDSSNQYLTWSISDYPYTSGASAQRSAQFIIYDSVSSDDSVSSASAVLYVSQDMAEAPSSSTLTTVTASYVVDGRDYSVALEGESIVYIGSYSQTVNLLVYSNGGSNLTVSKPSDSDGIIDNISSVSNNGNYYTFSITLKGNYLSRNRNAVIRVNNGSKSLDINIIQKYYGGLIPTYIDVRSNEVLEDLVANDELFYSYLQQGHNFDIENSSCIIKLIDLGNNDRNYNVRLDPQVQGGFDVVDENSNELLLDISDFSMTDQTYQVTWESKDNDNIEVEDSIEFSVYFA